MQSNNLLIESKQIVPANQNTTAKVNCAKECPCGVPVIKVPDQWLEVVVTGGFKVWHIIFIIIALLVIFTVFYCCFHRCRIPRTKQEIEADLLRTTLADKFSDYLHELSSEPTSFLEALKKVQELEEKFELDDALARETGVRKRMGWLKLKGKGNKDKVKTDTDKNKSNAAGDNAANDVSKVGDLLVAKARASNGDVEGGVQKPAQETHPKTKMSAMSIVGKEAEKQARPSVTSVAFAATNLAAAATPGSEPLAGKLAAEPGDKQPGSGDAQVDSSNLAPTAHTKSNGNMPTSGQHKPGPPSQRRRRRDKPNLSRTKATRDRSQSSQLEIGPPALAKPDALKAVTAAAPTAQAPTTTTTEAASNQALTAGEQQQTGVELTVPKSSSGHHRRHKSRDPRRHPSASRAGKQQAAGKATNNALAPP